MIETIAKRLSLSTLSVRNTVELLEEGATIPFIARYRKERTGQLDEVVIAAVRDAYEQLKELKKRKTFVLESIDSQGLLTPKLKADIESCEDSESLEDLYLPFKPKRNTKAEQARKKGLEALAKMIMAQNFADIYSAAERFTGSDGAASAEEAVEGAGHIIAEWMSENAALRRRLRHLFEKQSIIKSKKIKNADDEHGIYKHYYDKEEPVRRTSSHRILALYRGEREGILRVSIRPAAEEAAEIMRRFFIKSDSAVEQLMEAIIKDSYSRLLLPSLESELRKRLKTFADAEAIEIFKKNLEQLLMAPPLPGKRILAIDPGFRTGCKVVCLDENGNLLHNQTIYPHPPQRETKQAAKAVVRLVQQYGIDAIAIGNGTAGRETERFITSIRFPSKIMAVMVNESGASVYSASKVARQEFPQYDITVRGAVSIGRRLADPLAELVKIEPKAIGVGQYQHDVDQKELKKSLDDVVISCVNKVGVDLNTAGKELLQYVSGLGPVLASNIVEYRKQHGNFESREELLKVPRLGAKAFEQAAGFLRIRDAKNPLDNTAVHPEAYALVERLAADKNLKITDLIGNVELLDNIDVAAYADENFGELSIKDIIEELKKPNRDPRKSTGRFRFSDKVNSINDLHEGLVLPGIITNITAFGAFCDIGVHRDALIHISQLAEDFVKDPHEIVRLNQYVEVEVISLDKAANRINLKLLREL